MEGSPIQLFNGAGAMRLSVVSAAESYNGRTNAAGPGSGV